MTNGDDALAETIRLLRVEYLGDAPERVAELWAFHERAENGDSGALDELRRALHKLAGSGGSYGFPELSAKSRAGEHEAQRLLESGAPVSAAEQKTLRSMVQGVADEFADKSARGDPAPG